MANGYGSSTSSSNITRSATNAQGKLAPPGYHYMPDGTLMADSEHDKLYAEKVIASFNLDLSDLPAASSKRHFSIVGNAGSEFTLEIKNEDSYYYNFITNTFQVAKAKLEETILNNNYTGYITFPTITDNDQYDIYLYAKPGTKHADYFESRFPDGTLDINSSSGSNSLMMQKVIYQYTALTLTLAGYSLTGGVAGTFGTDTISVDRGGSKAKTAFSFTTTAGATAAYRILKQPEYSDILSFLEPVVGSTPEILPGENIYPTATAAFTGDDVDGAITSGSVVRMDGSAGTNLTVGDKITTVDTTGTVDGEIADGTVVTLDQTCSTLMAVGDKVDGSGADGSGTTLLVTVVGTGGNAKRFTVDSSTSFADGATLIFSSKVNRSLTTVTVVATSGADTDFTMSQAIQFRDNAPLTFFKQKNHQWPLDNINKIKTGMIVSGTNVTASSTVKDYMDSTTLFAGFPNEQILINNTAPALSTKNQAPTIVNGVVTVQPGNVVFNNQQILALAGDTIKIGGYGKDLISDLFGYNVEITDLAIALTTVSTTTTEATSAHATIAVADREGVINNVSRVGGIGIDPSVQNPLITSGGGADGAGDWVMGATQSLENGTTLTVENTGRIATITGNITISKVGNANATLRFDVDTLLSTSAP
tara:strand:+ start:232 stop:2178 length:1947 start_codon:yes stop_codon:yes gene_type:complete